MTSQKTIERCRAKVKELEETNTTLLHNNVVMAESNKKLRQEIEELQAANERARKNLSVQSEQITYLTKEKEACKQKCEMIVREKDQKLVEKERYIQSLHDTVWNLKNSYLCKTYNFAETPSGFELKFGFARKP